MSQVLSQAWMGWAGDRFGRRVVLIAAAVGPAIGFAVSAFSWSYYSLILAREE